MENGIIRIILAFLLISSLFSIQGWAQGVSNPKINTKAVSTNLGAAVGSAKANTLSTRECPVRLFTFQAPNWQGYYGYPNNANYFTPLVAGRDFVNDIKVCRFAFNGNVYIYGFEVFNGQQWTCVGATDPNLTENTVNNISQIISYGYDVLYVPKALNIAWVTQKSYPRFPKISPSPMGIQLSPTITGFLARCKITPDEAFDSSLVIRIPGVKLSFSDPSQLSVSYNGFDYNCDQEDLEFPICV